MNKFFTEKLLGPDKPSPADIHEDLVERHDEILVEIEERYKEKRKKNPDAQVKRPSILVMHLAISSLAKRILTTEGLDNGTCIHPREELKEKAQVYWDAVEEAGFQPEVRSGRAGLAGKGTTIDLMLRKPE